MTDHDDTQVLSVHVHGSVFVAPEQQVRATGQLHVSTEVQHIVPRVRIQQPLAVGDLGGDGAGGRIGVVAVRHTNLGSLAGIHTVDGGHGGHGETGDGQASEQGAERLHFVKLLIRCSTSMSSVLRNQVLPVSCQKFLPPQVIDFQSIGSLSDVIRAPAPQDTVEMHQPLEFN